MAPGAAWTCPGSTWRGCWWTASRCWSARAQPLSAYPVLLVPPPPRVTPGGAPVPPGSPGAALVDLNTADQALLESLPEVGPVTAQAILAWREEHGGFTAVQELLEVDGIGPATLETLAPLVTV